MYSDPVFSQRQGLWLALVAAVLFSAKAIVAKLIYRHGVDATTVLALRMLFSLPIFGAVAVWETLKARRAQPPLPARTRWRIILLGVLGYYLSSFLDFWGLEYISASLERLILFLNPTLVLLIGLLFLGRPVARAQWLAMFVSYAGIVMVFGENLRVDGAHVAFGAALVFGAALSYAFYLLLSGELLKQLGSLRLVAYAMCVSTVACMIHFALTRDLSDLVQPRAVYLLSVVNALFCTVVPVYFTMFAIDRIGPAATSQTAMVGPVSLLFLGWWILGEAITPIQVAGTAVVIAGIALLAGHSAAQAAKRADVVE
jgi:drug/metabolite transporter (DMT)-like permease